MDNREVTEFIIVPPYDIRKAVCRSRERLIHYLSTKFPGYSFKVASMAPVNDEDDFNVIPVMSFYDDEGRMRMCAYPKLWFMAEIARACGEFNRSQRQSWAAGRSLSAGCQTQ